MTASSIRVLAIGAAGKFAGLVVPALVARGAFVRGFVPKPEQADSVHAKGAAKVVVGDLKDAVAVAAALNGVHAVFYIAPAFRLAAFSTASSWAASCCRTVSSCRP